MPFFSPVHDYCVEVYTGDKFGAGTDANVYLEVCGDRGDTGQRHLHGTRTDGKMFERKMVRLGFFCDFYYYNYTCLGYLLKKSYACYLLEIY